MRFSLAAARVLDFDSENVPGFYWYDEKATDRLHTIAWKFVDDRDDPDYTTTGWTRSGLLLNAAGFRRFRRAAERADAVTGHNIIKHDIPLINAYCDRQGLPRIRWPHVIDTLQTIRAVKGMSRSQEFLGQLHKLEQAKKQVGLYTWEEAARGNPAACKVVVDRCVKDVEMHIQLFKKLHR